MLFVSTYPQLPFTFFQNHQHISTRDLGHLDDHNLIFCHQCCEYRPEVSLYVQLRSVIQVEWFLNMWNRVREYQSSHAPRRLHLTRSCDTLQLQLFSPELISESDAGKSPYLRSDDSVVAEWATSLPYSPCGSSMFVRCFTT